jgi:hypothetical protein
MPTPNEFEEGNMAIISLTIKVNISVTLDVEEHTLLGVKYSPKEVATYKSLF